MCCLPNRTMSLINIVKFSLLSLISFSHLVYSSSFFRKVPSSTYYKLQGLDLELPCISEQKNVSCFWMNNRNIITPQPGKYEFVNFSPTGDCSLTITNLEYPKDNSEWECQVPFSEISLKQWPRTQVVVLVKPSQPQIIYDNLTNSPTANKPTNISCRSSGGNPKPTLEWYLDDLNIAKYAKEYIEDQTIISTLSYTFKKKDNGSRLSCIVVHKTGQQSATQILNVQYKPHVSVKQKIYTVNEGSDLEIECQVDANPKADIFWKPANEISDSEYKVLNNKLLFRNITYTLDGKEFQCSAENIIGGSVTESVLLSVLYPPRLIEVQYPQKNITVGDDIQFKCIFKGNPKPKIRWYFTDAISNNLYYPEPLIENSEILRIRNVTYLNEGDYYCEGINYNSTLNKENVVPSSKFAVNIVGRPLFINDKETVIGYRGLDTKIEQSFCSDPRPEYVYWLYGSNRINVDPIVGNPNEEILDHHIDRFHIKTGRLIKIDSLSPNPTCFRVALMVTNTDTEDIRDYVLIVHNKYGKTEGIIRLQVNSPLSIAAVIAFGLIMLVIVLAITIGIILLRRRSNNMQLDPEIEEKAEVQVPNNDSYDIQKKQKKNGH